MVNLQKLISSLKKNEVEFITGVPDTLLNDFCLSVEHNWDSNRHVIAANEGNAIGLAAGYHLVNNSVPIVYMQNSGIGNTVNPLLSLTNKEVYSIPMVLLVGWRGKPGSNDWPQHQKQGEQTPKIFESFEIPYKELEDDTQKTLDAFEWAINKAKKLSSPVALLSGKGVLEKGEKDDFSDDQPYPLSREEAMAHIITQFDKDTLYVASTGRATRELHEIRNLNAEGHENDFLNVGAMGHTSSIAMGIALGDSKKNVVCFDGDSSTIMHMGALSVAGLLKQDNFFHVVLNNGVHESVGGQQSAGFSTDFNSVAKHCGYSTMDSFVVDKKGINEAINTLGKMAGPKFLEVRIRKGIRSDMPKLIIDHSELKSLFKKNLSKS